MNTTLLTRPETPLVAPDRQPPPPMRPTVTGRGPHQRTRIRWALLAAATTTALVGSVAAIPTASPTASPSTRSCVDSGILPCGAAIGDAFGGMTIDAAAMSETGQLATTAAVVAHVLGFPADQIKLAPATGMLTGSSGEFSFAPDDLTGADHFAWSYHGTEQNLGYLSVTTDRGMMVVGIGGQRTGTVDVAALLPGSTVTGARFWNTQALFVQPIAATTLHGPGFLGNSMIGRITNGTVPCVQVDTAAPATCAFHPDTSSWMESPQGDWALAGQPTSPTGEPGDWVTAAQVNPEGTYPALMATGHDTTGAPSAVPAAGGAQPEQRLTATNASGWPMENYATLEVCTSTYPHPDGATLTRSPSPGVYCYIGKGAALNDPRGIERDAAGVYLPETHNAHVILVGSTIVIAAKRPATSSTPAVITNSPLLWRPVVNMPIAND
ncbi:MAG: hypothetical protein ACRDS0_06235 [Pseudonocardiaceae bacterium]